MAAGPEDILQMQVMRYLRVVAPSLMVWHVPNGGYRNPREAKKLKDMGVLPGVADLCFLLPGGLSAFIELKVGKNPQTQSQKDFAVAAIANGAAYAVCRTLNEVDATLRTWGVPLRSRSPE